MCTNSFFKRCYYLIIPIMQSLYYTMIFIVIFIPVSIVVILLLVNFLHLNRLKKKAKDQKDHKNSAD